MLTKLNKAQVKRHIINNGSVTLQIVPHKLQPEDGSIHTFPSVEELEDTIAVLTIDPAIYNYQDGYYPAFYLVEETEVSTIPESPSIEVGTVLKCHTELINGFGHNLKVGDFFTVVEVHGNSNTPHIRIVDSSGMAAGTYVLRNNRIGMSYLRWFEVATDEPEVLENFVGDKVRLKMYKLHDLYTVTRYRLLQTDSDEWWDADRTQSFNYRHNAHVYFNQLLDELTS